ncbi:adenylosuccinate lyase [Candidatus Micrarchaeota archaeon]|nr:adenylosuccinate lyase [Candidatus Micrarchaeota archaeon]
MAAHPIDYRYGSLEMREVWEEERRLGYYLKVEAALTNALARMGKIPKEAASEISLKADSKTVTLSRVREIEAETRHDVMAMVKALTEQCGDAGKFVHLTATSYDIVDTAQALQLGESLSLISQKSRKLLKTLLALSEKHKNLVMAGRTHGQHALPITLGFKFANYADKLGQDIANAEWDRDNLVVGKFSGAVGTYSAQKLLGISGTKLEGAVMAELGLKPASISTQVVGREGVARIVSDVAILASTLEQIAAEIRNLQRTEIAEVGEPFGKSQVGSSTMAQKRNPVDCENVCGNARVVRGCVAPALENIALEHERDLTNSAAERSILPTVFLLTDEMLERMERVLSGLAVFPERMERNLQLTHGAIMAEAVITELVKKGMGRQEAHEIMRLASHEAMAKETPLKDVLLSNAKVKAKFSSREIDALLDYRSYTGAAGEKVGEIAGKWNEFLKRGE